ncbi:MAG: NAD(P)/FAD-dependent oxidoreductase [Promethearchaeota archaeon]
MSRSKIWDAIVCGAGVAGSVTAEELAAKGFSTLLLEKQLLPRYKACGGAVTQDFVDEEKLPENIIARHVEQLILHHVNYESYEKQGKGACLWRTDLDAFLTQRAVAEGATLRDKEPVITIKREKDLYLVQSKNSKYQGRTLIAADGVSSTVLQCFGWERFGAKDMAQTVTREIKLGAKTIAQRFGKQHLHLYFGYSVSQMGYGWVFPKQDTVSVGWGCQLSKIKNAKKEFASFLQILKKPLESGKLIRQAAHLLPAAIRKQAGKDGLLAVGDAAGLVDPISGKGIPYAALSGRLAAKVLTQSLETGEIEQAAKEYQTALEKELFDGLQKKKAIQADVYSSEEKIHRFLQLWLTHRATDIASTLWHV